MKVMKKVLVKGNEYVKSEYNRLGRILGKEISKVIVNITDPHTCTHTFNKCL